MESDLNLRTSTDPMGFGSMFPLLLSSNTTVRLSQTEGAAPQSCTSQLGVPWCTGLRAGSWLTIVWVRLRPGKGRSSSPTSPTPTRSIAEPGRAFGALKDRSFATSLDPHPPSMARTEPVQHPTFGPQGAAPATLESATLDEPGAAVRAPGSRPMVRARADVGRMMKGRRVFRPR